MKCPSCDHENPESSRRCVCGFTFVFEARPELPAEGGAESSQRSGALALALVAGLVGVAMGLLFGTHHIAREDRRAELGLLLVPIGLFAASGGIFGWSWFLENRRARLFVMLLGRTGARVFYGVLGGALIGLGLSFLA
jgi:hypothetical protein